MYLAAAACTLAWILLCGINPTAVPAAQYSSHSQAAHCCKQTSCSVIVDRVFLAGFDRIEARSQERATTELRKKRLGCE
jgi:tRNA isopentenyl-2-thiomethyl-A-37 hydroxylase MiaE